MTKSRCNFLPSRHTITKECILREVKELAKKRTGRRTGNIIASTQYSIDIISAILLLTGQITTSGIFFVPEGFYLAATGPILGGIRMTGRSESSSAVLDVVDVLTSILLILNVIRVTGPYLTSSRFFLVFSGPIFGIKDIVPLTEPDKGFESSYMALRDYIKDAMTTHSN